MGGYLWSYVVPGPMGGMVRAGWASVHQVSSLRPMLRVAARCRPQGVGDEGGQRPIPTIYARYLEPGPGGITQGISSGCCADT